MHIDRTEDPSIPQLEAHAAQSPQRQLWEGAEEPVTVRPETVTLLCADAPDDEWGAAEAALFAERFGAGSQCGEKIRFIFSFPHASAALRAAVVWQRLATGKRLRVSLLTAECMVARRDSGEHGPAYAFGPALERGAELALRAAGGTIAVSPESYALLRQQIASEVRDALVATEMDEDEVTHASIILAPEESAELSTFAGIGLS